MDIAKLKERLELEIGQTAVALKSAKTEEMLHYLDGQARAFRTVLKWLNEATK